MYIYMSYVLHIYVYIYITYIYIYITTKPFSKLNLSNYNVKN